MNLTVSSSPHIRKKITVENIMWTVAAALLPALIAGTYFFGVGALLIVLVSVASAVIVEYVIQKRSNRKVTLADGSAVITGLLLGLTLPPTVPLWIPVVGAAAALIIGKHVFGGLGHNIFNPALVGRAFLVASWPVLMTTWIKPFDAVTSATPLGLSKMGGEAALMAEFGSRFSLYWKLFIGNVGGSIGETSALLLLAGAGYLLYRRIITWHTPVAYVVTVTVLAYALRSDPLFNVLSGGLILGAFFMATDYVTTPLMDRGRIIFGVGAGIITMVIRLYGGLPEGITYSILIMNAFTPLIDRHTKPRIFGKK
ncbi:MAG: RnfABCDGE type electron transport complex subunit D [Candidatus Altiarchaeota archaeon]